MTDRQGGIAAAALLGFVLIVVYGPGLSGSTFVYEDQTWARMPAPPPLELRPRALTAWSWWWARAWSPAAHHWLGLGLHALVTAGVWGLCRRLGLSRLGAGVAASAFAVSVVAVETVAYAASRSELLAALGVLGACLAATVRQWWRWPLIVACLAVGILGKESAIVGLPLAALVLAYQERETSTAAPAVRLTVAIVILVDLCRAFANAGEAPGATMVWPDWLQMQSTAAVRVFGVMVSGLGATVDYDYDAVPQLLRAAAPSGLAGLAWGAYAGRRRWPALSFGLAWMLIAVLPRLIVQTPRSYLNEHQAYVAIVGYAFLLGSAFDWRRA